MAAHDEEKAALQTIPRAATPIAPSTTKTPTPTPTAAPTVSTLDEKAHGETKETKGEDGETSNGTTDDDDDEEEEDDDDNAPDAGPYEVVEIEQVDGAGLSAAEKGIAGIVDDDEARLDKNEVVHHQGGSRISATLSRIASNASSAVRRNNNNNNKAAAAAARLAASPVPLMDLDKGVVGWDSPDDPDYPLNFVPRRKWLVIVFLASMTLMTPFASSILAPGINFMDADFNNDNVTIGSLAVSIYLLCATPQRIQSVSCTCRTSC